MTRRVKDHIDEFFMHNLYLPTRTIFLTGEITSDIAASTIKSLHILDQQPEKPITILLNSPGGSVDDGFAIYDAIKLTQNEIYIKVFGCAQSMASIILQAADVRILTPNSTLMIHDGSVGYENCHRKTIQSYQDHLRIVDEKCVDLYLEKIRQKQPKFKRDKLKNLLVHDWVLTAEEAVNHGLADSILGEDDGD